MLPRDSSICLGLMSGTSLDAVDAVACRFDERGQLLEILGTNSAPFGADLRHALLKLQRDPAHEISLREYARLDQAVAHLNAAAAGELLKALSLSAKSVLALGVHGQTVLHDPEGTGSSLQLGNPNLIAAATGVRTVADLRRADIALGGHGAPLVPAFHHARFAADQPRVIVNIGGIANITVLPSREATAVFGFDTGPGNALMDDWIHHAKGEAFDRDGTWAASGRVEPLALAAWLSDPYFSKAPPKSTGRDYFNLRWLKQAVDPSALDAANVQRSVLELTCESIVGAIERHAAPHSEIYVCGGGARNPVLMKRLRERAASAKRVETTAELGLDPALIEACAFAWLAWRTIHGQAGNLTAVTGASRPARLGGVFDPFLD